MYKEILFPFQTGMSQFSVIQWQAGLIVNDSDSFLIQYKDRNAILLPTKRLITFNTVKHSV
jgi:hypothetical protein